MYNTKLELDQTVNNLTKASILTKHAKAIAQEIKRSTDDFYPNKIIDIKLDRVMFHIDAKLYKVKAEILKWLIGTSMIQVIFNFAFNTWGF